MRNELIGQLEDFDNGAPPKDEAGAALIGRLPPRSDGLFENCYLHEIYQPLTGAEIDLMEKVLGRTIPRQLETFFIEMNGLSLYCGSLTIKGLVKNLQRIPDVRLPISIEYGNLINRPMGGDAPVADPRNSFRFGSYAAGDGFELICDFDHAPIFMVPRYRHGPALAQWDSFEEFLFSEVHRMNAEFKESGKVCDPLNPLSPSCAARST